MRIGFDASPAVGERGGVGWHTYHLLRAMLALKEDIELVCYVRPGCLRDGVPDGWLPHRQVRWMEIPRSLLWWQSRWDCLDLFHGPNFRLRGRGRSGGVVTIHDLWLDRHPQYSKKLLGQSISRWRTRRTVWRARRVIAVSRFTAEDLQALYGLPGERITVIHNGISEDFRPSPNPGQMQEFRSLHRFPTERFILFVGGADPRKNHRLLFEACASARDLLCDHTLVLVGDERHRHGSFSASAAEFGVTASVVCLGRLDVQTLRLLYSHADALVFPSLYEGFGIPVIEAMACGTPVVTSTASALPEIAGDAALLVNPRDAAALAEVLRELLTDESLQQSLREKGFARAKAFSWSRAARETLALYREIVNK